MAWNKKEQVSWDSQHTCSHFFSFYTWTKAEKGFLLLIGSSTHACLAKRLNVCYKCRILLCINLLQYFPEISLFRWNFFFFWSYLENLKLKKKITTYSFVSNLACALCLAINNEPFCFDCEKRWEKDISRDTVGFSEKKHT